jgi:hypothetical protein
MADHAGAEVPMIQLSPDQFESLHQAREEDFKRRLAAFLREAFGQELCAVDDMQLAAMCESVISDAQELGITRPTPVAQLACLQIGSAGGVMKQPEVRAYLADQGVDEEARVQLLLDVIADAQAKAD